MALINCSECGKEYSDKAPACPNCGCPTQPGGMTPVATPPSSTPKKDKKKGGCLPGCLGAFAVFIVLGVIGAVVNEFEEDGKINACNNGKAEACNELLQEAEKSDSYIEDTSLIKNKDFKPRFDAKKKELEAKAIKSSSTALAIVTCKNALRASLKDPDSLKILNTDRTNLMIEYSATNAFGGRIRNVVDCKTGKVLY